MDIHQNNGIKYELRVHIYIYIYIFKFKATKVRNVCRLHEN